MYISNRPISWAVVVALLAERSLPSPENRRSNPVIGNTFNTCHLYFNIEKTKINEKEAGNGPFYKKDLINYFAGSSLLKNGASRNECAALCSQPQVIIASIKAQSIREESCSKKNRLKNVLVIVDSNSHCCCCSHS